MKWKELVNQQKLYLITIRVKEPGYSRLIKTTVFAANVDMAKKLAKAQYPTANLIGIPKEIK